MSRPIVDSWICTRPKVRYYGAYPCGFLEKARALLGVAMHDPVLHVCSGRVRDYPYRGVGPNDRTVDLDRSLKPDYCMDVRKNLPKYRGGWPALLADPDYTPEDAARHAPGSARWPEPGPLLELMLQRVRPGGRVGILHYQIPRPPDRVNRMRVKFVAAISVWQGFGNNFRGYGVFELQE